MQKVRAWIALGVLAWVGSAPAIAAPSPASAYAALPTGEEVRLAPDGQSVAMVGSSGGHQAIVVLRSDGTPLKVFSVKGWIPENVVWKSPTRLLVLVRTSWQHPDHDDRQFLDRRMLIMDVPSGGVKTVDFGGAIISFLPFDPDHILLSSNGVWLVNVASGGRSLVMQSSSNVVRWISDSAGKVRGSISVRSPSAFDHDQRRWLEYSGRADDEDSWHVLERAPVDGRLSPGFVAFDPANPDRMLLSVDGASGYRVVQAYSIRAGRPTGIVAQTQGADVTPITDNRRLVGYEVQGTSESFHYLEPAWDHDAQAMTRAVGGGKLQILDRTDDGRHVLAVLHDGSLPLLYWLLDRTGPKTTLKAMLNTYDGIAPGQIAPGTWITYPARDGMMISAILTMPLNTKPGPVPFVMFPHGGPHLRDPLEFDWTVQFLVSRGYGVLQPQFRASFGFGKKLYDAGFHQWGGAIQDDIVDGARAMVARHLADSARLAIVGASFGGYCALEELEHEPGLFHAAVAFAPVTDLPLLEGGMHLFARKDFYVVEAGESYAEIEAASPLHGIERVSAPILIVHGEKDFTVPVKQSELLVHALKDAGKPVQAVYLPEADHYPSDSADRLVWLQALGTFLSANLHVATPVE